MDRGKKNLISSLSYSVLANGINTIISFLVVLILPRFFSVGEYAYWQLYSFYISYIGFFHFGWADGIYLKIGGKRYSELDEKYIGRQFWLLAAAEFIVGILIIFVAILEKNSFDRKLILAMCGICCAIQIPKTMLQYVLQTTDRIKDYARNYIQERMIYFILVITILLFGIRSYKILICADLAARAISLVLLYQLCHEKLSCRINNWRLGIIEAWDNIKVGIKLMFANVASLLITGIVRFSIERQWDIETFGKISLTMTVSNLLMILINAISIVMYPILRNTPSNKLAGIYSKLRSMLTIPLFGMLLIYYPVEKILSAWLPQYKESLRYMALLFPMCVFESKTSMLTNTYLKTLREERTIMLVNWLAVIATLLGTIFTVFVYKNLTLATASLTFFLAFRNIVGESCLASKLNINVKKDMVMEVALAAVFMLSSWYITTWKCVLVYGSTYLLYLFLHRKDFMSIFSQIKK